MDLVTDDPFGPVIVFCAGGTMIELFGDRAMELPPAMLARFTLIDCDCDCDCDCDRDRDREMALVAVLRQREADATGRLVETERIVGVSRYITHPDRTSCEFSLVVANDFSSEGLGSRLMGSVMEMLRDKGLAEIEGPVLSDNAGLIRLMGGLGFAVKPFPEDRDFVLVSHSL